MWSDRRDPKSPSDPHPVVWQSESFDGGLTWQKERVILGVPGQWAQPSVMRSPDGTIVATAYVKYAPGPEQNSVVSTRFTLAETDAMPVTLPSPRSVHGR